MSSDVATTIPERAQRLRDRVAGRQGRALAMLLAAAVLTNASPPPDEPPSTSAVRSSR